MATCGEKGFRRKDGAPCGQSISPTAAGCKFHLATPAERHDIAMKGALSASLKQALPEELEIGALDTIDDVKRFLRSMVQWVLKRPIDRWRMAEARGLLSLYVQIEQVQATQRLADAVLTSTHGGQSLVFLNQFLEGGADTRRKLPGRIKVLPENTEELAS